MADLEAWKAKLVTFLNEHRGRMDAVSGVTLPRIEVEIDVGTRYARVWKRDGSSKSAYAFIEMATGDLLKPATWKAPAKHARGNIFAENPLGGCGPYGMAYLR